MTEPKKLRSIAVRYVAAANDGKGAFVPLHPRQTAKLFEDGEFLFFRPDRKRYWPSHQAFMALIREAWESLPDSLQEQEFQTPDVLRRRLLIAAEFGSLLHIVCESEAEFQRRLREFAACINERTFISVHGLVIVLATAPSQAMDAMTEDTFKASCAGVRKQLAILLGCSEDDIKAHAETLRAKKLAEAEPA